MNYGPLVRGCLHAPSATIDDKGRFIAIFNLHEGIETASWHGMMSLPRRLSLADDNSLRIEPIPALESLRFAHKHVGPTDIPAGGEMLLNGIRGKAMEVQAEIEPRAAREVGVNILRSPSGEEQTTVTLYRGIGSGDRGECLLGIDISRASLRPDVRARPPEIGPLRLGENGPLKLRIFIDRSSVEVFANGKQCLTVRVYPERADSNGVSVFARGGAARLVSLDAWQMHSIWPELAPHEGK